MNATERMYYAMGLFVGEGSFTGDKVNPCIYMKLHANNPEPLKLMRTIFGGKIYGAYRHGGRHYNQWMLRNKKDIQHALPLFEKYLPESEKRVQFNKWLKKYESKLKGDIL